ncbi:sulfate transport system substrate-binding protein [Endobacter medicaginis]|uniref:Sulfate ABC transporter substrate-binding protein n=1 Tax=Endobacter medicaginis TaxID=1181271 RepID=A0A839V2L3_9PROT|nr:sulfate transport system substrate-binding protein [Endobacter medicaginis]NVN31650.1 sulfate ABC transporter substrate-binding protein [Endobacter medicaginis]
MLNRRRLLSAAASIVSGTMLASICGGTAMRRAQAATMLLNASFDPTRELFHTIDAAFAADWRKRTGEALTVRTSNGGSGAQAKSVLDGQPADVVTLALAADIDMLAAHGLLEADWQDRLPNRSTPYSSTIVFLVRKGNPKNIHDWPDLIRPGVQIITPNPKTSGGARWNYLAAWAWALHQPGGSPATAEAYLKALYHQVPVLDTGARGATNSFLQRGLGDVLLAWEDEALLAHAKLAPDEVEVVRPSLSILAAPPVAVVTRNAQAHGTEKQARAYLEFLYTPAAQEIVAANYFRPSDKAVLAKYADRFTPITTVDIESLGGWTSVQKTHFAEGGVFDKLL